MLWQHCTCGNKVKKICFIKKIFNSFRTLMFILPYTKFRVRNEFDVFNSILSRSLGQLKFIFHCITWKCFLNVCVFLFDFVYSGLQSMHTY